MSAEPRPCRTSPSTRGRLVAVGGDGVEVAAEHDAPVASELGARATRLAPTLSTASDGARAASRSRTIAASSAS